MDNQCLNCPDRWVKGGKSCHSTCPKYLAAVKREEALKKKIFEEKGREQIWYDYQKNGPLHKRWVRDTNRNEAMNRKKY